MFGEAGGGKKANKNKNKNQQEKRQKSKRLLKSHTISSSHGVPPAQLQPSGGGRWCRIGDVFPRQLRKEARGEGGGPGLKVKEKKKKVPASSVEKKRVFFYFENINTYTDTQSKNNRALKKKKSREMGSLGRRGLFNTDDIQEGGGAV